MVGYGAYKGATGMLAQGAASESAVATESLRQAEVCKGTSCFTGETPLLVPLLGGDGLPIADERGLLYDSKPIAQFRKDDLLLSRPEGDPAAAPEIRRVEEVFFRRARVLRLTIAGKEVGTTAAHPFFAREKGWTEAGNLAEGDSLLGHDGNWATVEAVCDTGRVETVYNVRVADYHTYFVGARSWGFTLWAHNYPDEVAEGDDLYRPDGTPWTSPEMAEGTLDRYRGEYAVETGAVSGDRASNRGMNNPVVQSAKFIGDTFHYDRLNGGTGEYGPTQLTRAFPHSMFRFAFPAERGADVEFVDGIHPSDTSVYPNTTWDPANNYGDFKPNTASGRDAFWGDIASGKLPPNTQILVYDPATLTLDASINPK